MSDEASLKLGFDLSTLDILLDSFARSGSDPSIDRGRFYADINRKMVASTQSIASAIWVKSSSGQIRPIHQIGWDKIPDDQRGLLQDLVRGALSEARTAVSKDLTNLKAFTGVSTTLNGLTFAYLLVRPSSNSSESEIVDQIFEDLTGEIAAQIETFENARASSHRVKSERDLTHIAQMVQNLGKAETLQQMAFHLVNDLAKITDASRVTYLNNRGKVLAISGVSQVSLRTSVARDITRVAKSALRHGCPFEWADGEVVDDAQSTPRDIRQIKDRLPSPTGFAFTIGGDGPQCGALLLEYFSDAASESAADQQQLGIEQRELINETIQFTSPVIQRNFRLFSIPAIGGMDLLFNRLMVRPVRLLGWLALFGLVFLLVCYGLFFVQRPFEIYGEGVLRPAQQQHVFSQVEGEVVQLLVEEGANVKQGQTLLTIASKTLEKELIAIEGEIGEARQELQNLKLADSDQATGSDIADDETQKASDIERLKIRLESLNAQLQFFENRKSQLTVQAPISGQVTTPELRQRLTTRPIDRGDLLMTLAEVDGQWEVELKIPDNLILFVTRAMHEADENGEENAEIQPLDVEFRLASASKKTYDGQLKSVDFRSDLRSDQEESIVLTEIAIDESELGDSLRLGARVYGKIDCGKRSNFFLLTYEIRNRLRQWWF